MNALRQWLADLGATIVPRVCEVCGRSLVAGEDALCLSCLGDIPRTGFHRSDFNEVHKRVASTTPVMRAAAYFHYSHDCPYSALVRRAKYNGEHWLDRRLAAKFAAELAADGFFDGIDAIVPVPLHWLKRMRRGYNQSLEIARGMAAVAHMPVLDILRAAHHPTQTRRHALDRWLNTEGVYSLAAPPPPGVRHILFVDDVITTGATMLHCAEAIAAAAPYMKTSVPSLAITRS